MRIVFFGSAEFAIPTLTALKAAGHTIIEVVSQPDRPAGRGQQLQPPPLAAHAKILGLSLYQPEKLRTPEAIAHCLIHDVDIFVVVAYGQIVPNELLTKYRCVNLHPSLLPKYRGAAPIQWPIIQGDTITGVTTMFLVEALDAGDILLQYPVAIAAEDTAGSMHDKLSEIGARLVVETLQGLEAGSITPAPQDESKASYAEKLSKAHGRLKWDLPAEVLARLVRGLHPWPAAHAEWNGKQLTLHKAVAVQLASGSEPGNILAVGDTITVATGEGRLLIESLQLEGGRVMTAREFINGHQLKVGDKFL